MTAAVAPGAPVRSLAQAAWAEELGPNLTRLTEEHGEAIAKWKKFGESVAAVVGTLEALDALRDVITPYILAGMPAYRVSVYTRELPRKEDGVVESPEMRKARDDKAAAQSSVSKIWSKVRKYAFPPAAGDAPAAGAAAAAASARPSAAASAGSGVAALNDADTDTTRIYTLDPVVETINKRLAEVNSAGYAGFFGIVLATSGYGKTTMVGHLLHHSGVASSFDEVYVINPAMTQFADGHCGFHWVPKEARVRYDPKRCPLTAIFRAQEKRQEAGERLARILIIADDCGGDAAKTTHATVSQMAMRGRHMNISLVYIVQRFTKLVPPDARDNATFFLVGTFPGKQVGELAEAWSTKLDTRSDRLKTFFMSHVKDYTFAFSRPNHPTNPRLILVRANSSQPQVGGARAEPVGVEPGVSAAGAASPAPAARTIEPSHPAGLADMETDLADMETDEDAPTEPADPVASCISLAVKLVLDQVASVGPVEGTTTAVLVAPSPSLPPSTSLMAAALERRGHLVVACDGESTDSLTGASVIFTITNTLDDFIEKATWLLDMAGVGDRTVAFFGHFTWAFTTSVRDLMCRMPFDLAVLPTVPAFQGAVWFVSSPLTREIPVESGSLHVGFLYLEDTGDDDL